MPPLQNETPFTLHDHRCCARRSHVAGNGPQDILVRTVHSVGIPHFFDDSAIITYRTVAHASANMLASLSDDAGKSDMPKDHDEALLPSA